MTLSGWCILTDKPHGKSRKITTLPQMATFWPTDKCNTNRYNWTFLWNHRHFAHTVLWMVQITMRHLKNYLTSKGMQKTVPIPQREQWRGGRQKQREGRHEISIRWKPNGWIDEHIDHFETPHTEIQWTEHQKSTWRPILHWSTGGNVFVVVYIVSPHGGICLHTYLRNLK